MTKIGEKALVLFSGGQDSTTCLFWAKKHFEEVETVSFLYGQRHKVELEFSEKVCKDFDIQRTVVDASFISSLGGSDLLLKDTEIKEIGERGLPTSFIPGRNVYFLSIAASLAYQKNIHHLVTGTCQTDFSGYPDCRDSSIKALQVALSSCLAYDLSIHTPLMWLNKAKTWALANELDCLDIVKHSHTCYNGVQGGCGECPACKLRIKGFEEFQASLK